MASRLKVNYSNRLEQLYVGLRDCLFGERRGPFSQRLVVVPTHAIKSWLQQRLAEDPAVGVAAGIDFLFLEEAVARWAGRVAADPLAMSLAIERALREGVEEGLAGWEPVISYLKPDQGRRRMERRAGQLAAHLADLFAQYGLYGGKMMESWSGWQADVWKACGFEALSAALEAAPATPLPDGQLHLFGFSHLAPAYHRFFKRLGRVMPVAYHVLSPCEAYWGDVKSDRERRYMKRFLREKGAREEELDQLDAILRDSNALIANLGRLGREYFLLLEDGESETVENYVLPEGNTPLERTQADMLELIPPMDRTPDPSVQVHAATSRWREVQVLHNRLLGLMDGTDITPGDVVVMAPDIGAYAPFVETVFGKALPYQLHDLHSAEPGSLVDGFAQLIELASGRWRVSRVLSLLEHPAFAARTKLEPDELRQIRHWIQRCGVRWGFDVAHRDEQLSASYGNREMLDRRGQNTWSGGIDQLLVALADDGSAQPLVELSQADLLNRFVGLLESLREDLRPLQGDQELSLCDWCDYLDCLAEAYFFVEGESFAPVSDRLRRLGGEEQLSFVTVGRLLQAVLEEKSGVRGGHQIDAVRFCSMLPMRAIPARVVCLLGMEEGAFPRTTRQRPFDQMSGREDVDRLPSRSDVDRYLFLEALLSARDHLLIFYRGVGEGDGQPQGPSAVVDELISYANLSVERHPYLSCHQSYFTGEPTNYDRLDYAQAEAMSRGPESRAPMPAKPAVVDFEGVVEIEVGDLRATASDPCRYYLKRALGMQIDEEWSGGIADEETLALSTLDQHRLVWESLVRPVEEVLAEASAAGVLPAGPFEEVARRRLLKAVAEHEERLQAYGVDRGEFVTVRLSDEDAEREGELRVPPLELEVRAGLRARITGEIPFVSPQGLFVAGKGEAASALRAWPLILLLDLSLPKEFDRQLLFAKGGSPLRLEDRGQERLRHYLAYHLLCGSNLSPLLPRWLPDYLSGRIEAMHKQIKGELGGGMGPYVSPYVKWSVEQGVTEVDPTWREMYEGAFAWPIRNWFGETP